MKPFWHVFFLLIFSFSTTSAYSAFEKEYAYNFSLPNLKQKSQNLQLSDYRGKVVWLEFWASWCHPCREIFPKLNIIRNDLHDLGFEVISISIDREASAAKIFIEQNPVDFPVLHDQDGRISRAFAVRAVPTGVLIDQNGVIIFSHQGNRTGDMEKLRREINSLLTSTKPNIH